MRKQKTKMSKDQMFTIIIITNDDDDGDHRINRSKQRASKHEHHIIISLRQTHTHIQRSNHIKSKAIIIPLYNPRFEKKKEEE